MTLPRRHPSRQVDVGPHLGADVAALADGQLRGGARDRALGHVAVCVTCRAEVEDQRRLKAELGSLPGPVAPPPVLQDLLLGLARPSVPISGHPGAPLGSFVGLAAGFVPAAVPAPAGSEVARPSRRRAAVLAGVAIGVLGGGLGFALAEGGPEVASVPSPSGPLSSASPEPNAVVMLPGGARRELPLVADLQSRR